MKRLKGLSRKIMIFMMIGMLMYTIIGSDVNTYGLLENQDHSHNILIINSYNENNLWEKEIVDSIKSEIKNINVNIGVEYLDYKNVTNQEYYAKFNELLKSKYDLKSIDAIVAIDDEAFYFFKEQVSDKENKLYNIPLIYAGVNYRDEIVNDENQTIIGIYSKSNIVKLINLIQTLDTKVKTIDVIFEESVYCDQMVKEINEATNVGWNDVNVNLIQSNYIEEVLKELSDVKNKGQAIILAGEFKYSINNKIINPEEVITSIKNNTDSPIYSIDRIYLNQDILGGIYSDGIKIGKSIGEVIIDILENKEINYDILRSENAQQMYFDYNNIYISNLDVYKIPKEAKILNKPFYGILLPKPVRIFGVLFFIMLAIVFIILISYNIDKKTQLLVEKREKERAKERERLQSDFIVNMSHELRTPLNIVINSAKLIELKVKNGEYDEEYLLKRLHNINQNSNRLLKIINNVIDITKVESGFLSLNLRNYNIVEVIEEIFEEVIDFANKKNIEIVFDTTHEEIITAFDREKIERVVLNILSNSIKYTPEGGGIHGKVSKAYDMIQIEIEDNGFGIPEDKLKDIFHRFYQVESTLSRSNEGSGIGLCIVKELVNLHNGYVNVESKLGQGTKFIIQLPIIQLDKSQEVEDKMITNLTDIVNREMSDVNK